MGDNFHWHAQYRCRMCMLMQVETEGCRAYGTLDEVIDNIAKSKVHHCTFGRIGIMVLEGIIRDDQLARKLEE